MKRLIFSFFALLCVTLLSVPCAMAQEAPDELPPSRLNDSRIAPPRVERAKPATPPAQEAPAPILADPPYQKRYERLSEILGALHYLRPLCVKGEEQVWRQLMLNLLDAENPAQSARERMISSFNHAYRGFSENYRRCTPSARLAGQRYREEGIKLARDLTSLFTD